MSGRGFVEILWFFVKPRGPSKRFLVVPAVGRFRSTSVFSLTKAVGLCLRSLLVAFLFIDSKQDSFLIVSHVSGPED